MEKKKKTELEKFHELYGYNPSSTKWVPVGGEILKLIGNDVVYVSFIKDATGKWSSSYENARIISISNFDPVTMTYNIKYRTEKMKDTEWKEERIIPEAFSFDIAGSGIQNTMNRFVPRSMHCSMVETEMFYNRLFKLYAKRDTMPLIGLQSLNDSKEQKKTLEYCCNIGAVIKASDDNSILYFRIGSLKLRHKSKDTYILTISDWDTGKKYMVEFGKLDKSYQFTVNGENIGQLKIIDLKDE